MWGKPELPPWDMEHQIWIYSALNQLKRVLSRITLTIIISLPLSQSLPIQVEFVMKIIVMFQLADLGEFCHLSVNTAIGVFPAVDGREEQAAKSFHWECPITPDRSALLDAVSNVE